MKRKCFIAAILLINTLLLAISPVQTEAASNGQLIGLYCNTAKDKVEWMSISGTNQYGQPAYFAGAPSNADSAWVVWDWWWKGPVDVWWLVKGRGFGHLTANIPAVSWFDLYIIGRCA